MEDGQTAYSLVQLMSGSHDFEQEDRQAAINFAKAVKRAGVQRTIDHGDWATMLTRLDIREFAA